MSETAGGPPERLVRELVDGPSLVRAVDWRPSTPSTNVLAADAAAEGAAEGHLVLADHQSAGRGRLGRTWQAPPGTSLLLSLLLRPAVPPGRLASLPLLAGLCLAEACARLWGDAPPVRLKWPNDMLVGGRKAAGVLTEVVAGGAVVLGAGVDVDWRGVGRPPGLAAATSLAEAVGGPVDRWAVLAGFVGALDRRYGAWRDAPQSFMDDYRARCATLGRRVRVRRLGAPPLQGRVVDLGRDGALMVRTADGGTETVAAGDVEHVTAPWEGDSGEERVAPHTLPP